MKLTTLNLQGFVDWDKREQAIVTYLKDTNSDIVFFQEVVFIPEISPDTSATRIGKQLDYPYTQTVVSRLQTSDLYTDFREGLSIMSKFPITHSETLVLKQNKHDHLQRIVQLFNVVHRGVTTKFANIHFAQNPELAYEHLEELLEIFKSRNEQRTIIGDFNMPDLKHLTIWQEQYNASTSEYYISFPGNNNRIDFVLTPKPTTISKMSLSPDGISDHRALTVTIT